MCRVVPSCDAEDCRLKGKMKKKVLHRMPPDIIKDDVKHGSPGN